MSRPLMSSPHNFARVTAKQEDGGDGQQEQHSMKKKRNMNY